jgi:hypothetical protein
MISPEWIAAYAETDVERGDHTDLGNSAAEQLPTPAGRAIRVAATTSLNAHAAHLLVLA